jgi:hypothetical protein
MKSRDFVYWLQGFFEISDIKTLTEHQVKIIRNHLNLVFKHEIDPSMPDPTGELQAIHDGQSHPLFTPHSATNLRC